MITVYDMQKKLAGLHPLTPIEFEFLIVNNRFGENVTHHHRPIEVLIEWDAGRVTIGPKYWDVAEYIPQLEGDDVLVDDGPTEEEEDAGDESLASGMALQLSEAQAKLDRINESIRHHRKALHDQISKMPAKSIEQPADILWSAISILDEIRDAGA